STWASRSSIVSSASCRATTRRRQAGCCSREWTASLRGASRCAPPARAGGGERGRGACGLRGAALPRRRRLRDEAAIRPPHRARAWARAEARRASRRERPCCWLRPDATRHAAVDGRGKAALPVARLSCDRGLSLQPRARHGLPRARALTGGAGGGGGGGRGGGGGGGG